MNFSEFKSLTYHYLSPHAVAPDGETDRAILSCLEELEAADCFRALHAEYDAPPEFLKNEPYASFLEGADGCYLIACTLGAEIDRRLRRLSVTELSRMLLFDAAANAYLEMCAEAYKNALEPGLSYIFCPGYQGSDVGDLRFIFDELRPSRIGIELTEAGLMLPQKTIVGIAGRGNTPAMRCGDCVKKQDCVFRKEGKVCFRSEKN